ncbi:uncharacterized protein LOC122389072 isoform X1 [Amphibalanus amphitrite]|uniref:uncharacterized protein LOC122389072 isoform X1 n=1 Tax=Amphibalanus amphitrite TaxID=1232801 RepID=UPI001C9242D1|nr:uncharacterized protein LOC122389072 isoform X1 [Amphibalanus amphitrite]
MFHLLLTAAAVAAAGGLARPSGARQWLDGYSGQHQTGSLITYHDSASSLGGWNDLMRSACINGFWVFYEHDQFNYESGKVLWAYGFNYCFTFREDMDKQVSSVRPVGHLVDAAADSLTLFEGTLFSGSQVFIDASTYNVSTAYGYQSVIVTGPDAWTIYSGDNYTGYSVCLYSGSDSAVSPSGQKITYGLFPTADYLGVVGSDIRSARKGCYSGVTLRGQPLTAENHISTVVEEEWEKALDNGYAFEP